MSGNTKSGEKYSGCLRMVPGVPPEPTKPPQFSPELCRTTFLHEADFPIRRQFSCIYSPYRLGNCIREDSQRNTRATTASMREMLDPYLTSEIARRE